MSDIGTQRLIDLFEKMRSNRGSTSARYQTDDVIAVLYLLGRYWRQRNCTESLAEPLDMPLIHATMTT